MIHTYPDILAFNAVTFPERIALYAEDQSITYKELHATAARLAVALQQLSLRPGDRVAFLDLNTLPYVHMVNACFLCGATPVSINWRLTPAEMQHILSDAGCTLLLYGEYFSATIPQLYTSVNSIELSAFVESNRHIDADVFAHPSYAAEDTALLVYTSGTTGMPKGVCLSHANLFEMYYSLRSVTPEFGATSINLVAGPWYAVVGIGYFVFGVFTGCTNVLLRIFDPLEVCRLISVYRVTNAFMPPVMLRVIVGLQEDLESFDLSSMRHIQYGGAPMDPGLLRKCADVFGCLFTQGYGLTETSGIGTALRYDDHLLALNNEQYVHRLRSAGKPYDGIEVLIIQENGNRAPVGEPGEVYMRGPAVATGYWHLHADGTKEFDAEGWFHTGDMGYMDAAGYLFLIDRKNDLIISRGNNIYPAEIEQIIAQHPNIHECAVMAVPHEVYGEAVGVAVVCKETPMQLQELRTWLHGKLPEYKLPVVMDVWDALPRNPTGKVVRRELRAKYWHKHQRAIQ